METKGFFQFESIITVSVSSFRFIWIPMLWVYGQIINLRIWRIKPVSALKGLNLFKMSVIIYVTIFEPFKPSRCIKALFYIPEYRFNFPTTKGFRMNIPMKLAHQYMAITFTFSPTSSHLHSLQAENYDRNLRLVVDEDDNIKSGLKGLNQSLWILLLLNNIILTKNSSRVSLVTQSSSALGMLNTQE